MWCFHVLAIFLLDRVGRRPLLLAGVGGELARPWRWLARLAGSVQWLLARSAARGMVARRSGRGGELLEHPQRWPARFNARADQTG